MERDIDPTTLVLIWHCYRYVERLEAWRAELEDEQLCVERVNSRIDITTRCIRAMQQGRCILDAIADE